MSVETPETRLGRLEERLIAMTNEYTTFRVQIVNELQQIRTQTNEWVKLLVNKLPTWAIFLGQAMAAAIGSMATYILYHK